MQNTNNIMDIEMNELLFSFRVSIIKKSIGFFKRKMDVLEQLLKEWNDKKNEFYLRQDIYNLLFKLNKAKLELIKDECFVSKLEQESPCDYNEYNSINLRIKLQKIYNEVESQEKTIEEITREIRHLLKEQTTSLL
jgi:hypothetical protein